MFFFIADNLVSFDKSDLNSSIESFIVSIVDSLMNDNGHRFLLHLSQLRDILVTGSYLKLIQLDLILLTALRYTRKKKSHPFMKYYPLLNGTVANNGSLSSKLDSLFNEFKSKPA